MSELKPCPREAEALDIIESLLDMADMKCTGPLYADDPPRNGLCRIPEEDAAILRQYIAYRRAQPANEPLTLEQLRETHWRDPVWLSIFDNDGRLCSTWCHLKGQGDNLFEDGFIPLGDYGKTWLAYRRQPAEAG